MCPAHRQDDMPAPLVLVELNLDRLSGHWAEYVPTLARAAPDWPGEVVLLGGGTVADDIRERLAGCKLVQLGDHDQPGQSGFFRPPLRRRGLRAGRAVGPGPWPPVDGPRVAAVLDRLYFSPLFRNGRARFTRRQIALARRCCIEVAVLRLVRRQWSRRVRVVLLTASEGLAITTAVLSRLPHVRVVHEVRYREGRVLQVLEGTLRRFAGRVVQVCPAASVEEEVRAKAVRTRTVVRPFSLKDPAIYLSDAERRDARQTLGISDTETVGCYLGGWWHGKDWHTAIAGIAGTSKLSGMIIAGDPIDPSLVERLRRDWSGRVHTLLRPLTSEELRRFYAASDFTLVCRHRGVTKESGLVMDAVRYGIHLVTSDHDPQLAEYLAQVPWAAVFSCGNPDSLAQALDAATAEAARPRPADRDAFGTYSARDTLEFFARLGQDVVEGVANADK